MVCEFKRVPVFLESGFGKILRFANPQINRRYAGTGGIFGSYTDDKFVYHPDWEEKHANSTWEINWPSKAIFGWPKGLLGWMPFEGLWGGESSCEIDCD